MVWARNPFHTYRTHSLCNSSLEHSTEAPKADVITNILFQHTLHNTPSVQPYDKLDCAENHQR